MPVSSDQSAKVILIGGQSDFSGVPRHISHLHEALKTAAEMTIVSDEKQGFYADLTSHRSIAGLACRGNVLRLAMAIWTLLRLLRHNPPDLVWLHAPVPAFAIRIAFALRIWQPNCPVVLTYHAQPFAAGHRKVTQILFIWMERALLHLSPAHHLIFLTTGMMSRTTETLGSRALSRHAMHILENCANARSAIPTYRANTRHILMVGRMCRQKNHNRALRLFTALPPDTRLTLCGPGTDSAAMHHKIAQILPPEARDRVTCVGPVHTIGPYLACADALLLTSRYEGHPICALEAFEAGIPMILTDFEGAKELVDAHPCAVCLPDDNPSANAETVTNIISRFKAQEPLLRAQTQSIWRTAWSPVIFNRNARALLKTLLNQPA